MKTKSRLNIQTLPPHFHPLPGSSTSTHFLVMNEIKQIHAHTLRRGVDQTQFLIVKLLQIPNLHYAQSLLLLLLPTSPTSTHFLFNKLLQAYSLHGPFTHCISHYSRMRLLRLPPTPHSFTFLFSACASFSRPRHGLALHSQLLKSGIPFDPFLSTSLLDFYSKSGLLSSARQLFDEIPQRDIPLHNSLIAGYTKGGDLIRAKELFDGMPVRNVISWTSMVSGYSQNGRFEEAVEVFLRMWEEGEVMPNQVTLASVLPACANLGAMGLGMRIEEYARENGLVGNLFVGNGLVEMYAKCGSIDRARRVFDEIGERRNLCSWNSMIMGLAVHGRWKEGLELFHEMRVTLLLTFFICNCCSSPPPRRHL